MASLPISCGGFYYDSDSLAVVTENDKPVLKVVGDSSVLVDDKSIVKIAGVVGIKGLSKAIQGQVLRVGEDGNVEWYTPTSGGGDVDEYNLVKKANSGEFAAVYNLTKNGSPIGDSINIPKDMLLESGVVVENPDGQPEGTYIELKFQDISTPLYINVNSLIEYVTSGSQSDDMVVVDISDDHKVTASITNNSITKEKLTIAIQDAIALALTALQIGDIASGNQNGTIAVEGKDVAVKGLGSAAYTDTSDYDAFGSADTVKNILLGASDDASNANTIHGVKNLAYDVENHVANLENDLERKIVLSQTEPSNKLNGDIWLRIL